MVPPCWLGRQVGGVRLPAYLQRNRFVVVLNALRLPKGVVLPRRLNLFRLVETLADAID